jgi:16S rRNA (guanine527-N7)-methyltransferase
VAEATARFGVDDDRGETLVELARAAVGAEISSGTSVATVVEAAQVHIADSLAVFDTDWLTGCHRMIDIGSGLGFPGLAIAAVRPEVEVTLLDGSRKKSQAAARIARRCGIANVTCIWGRAEEVAETGSPHRGRYDVVTARALAPLAVLAEYAAPLLREDGSLIAWKASPDEAEVRAGRAAAELVGLLLGEPHGVEPFAGAGGRTLWRARKVRPTPEAFPRRAGVAARSPLA